MTPTAFQKTDTEGAARGPRISCDRQRWRLATPVYQSTSNQNSTLLQLVVLVVPGSGTSECATNTDFLSLKLGKMAKGHKLPQRSHSSILDRPRGIVPLCLRSPQGSPPHPAISAAPTIRRRRTSFFLWILLFCLAPPQKDPSRTSGHAEDGTTPPQSFNWLDFGQSPWGAHVLRDWQGSGDRLSPPCPTRPFPQLFFSLF